MIKILILSLFILAQVPKPPEPVKQDHPPEAQSNDIVRALDKIKSLDSKKLSVSGPITVPAYSMVKLSTSNVTGPVVWICINFTLQATVDGTVTNAAGTNFEFTGPPGNYLVLTINNGLSTQTSVTIEPPVTPVPVPVPIPVPPTPNPSPQPAPDPSTGFIYPPNISSDLTTSITAILRSKPNPQKVAYDSKKFKDLYYFIADKIESDGERQPAPLLKTVGQTLDLVKSEGRNMFIGTRIGSLKESYPEIFTIANQYNAGVVGSKLDAPFTIEMRQNYIAFLRSLAAGFEKVAK